MHAAEPAAQKQAKNYKPTVAAQLLMVRLDSVVITGRGNEAPTSNKPGSALSDVVTMRSKLKVALGSPPNCLITGLITFPRASWWADAVDQPSVETVKEKPSMQRMTARVSAGVFLALPSSQWKRLSGRLQLLCFYCKHTDWRVRPQKHWELIQITAVCVCGPQEEEEEEEEVLLLHFFNC